MNANRIVYPSICEMSQNQPGSELICQPASEKSDKSIELVRKIVLREFENHPELFAKADIDRIRKDDWFVKKFFIYKRRDVHSAAAKLLETLKWRKAEGAHDVKVSDLPDIYHRLGSFFLYEPDKNGREVFYARIKHYRRNNDLRPLVIKFGIALGCKIERESPNGIVLVMDFKDFQLTRAFDLEIIRLLTTTLLSHFPLLTREIYITNLPGLLQKFSSIVMNLVPTMARSRVKFLSEKMLKDYIDIDKIPDCLGGTCKRPYKGPDMVPEGSPTLVEYGQRIGWSKAQYSSIYEIAKELSEIEAVEPPQPPEMFVPLR